MSNEKISLRISEQGISEEFTIPEAKEFFQSEIAFFRRVQPLIGESLVINNMNFGGSGLYQGAIRALQEIINGIDKNDLSPLLSYEEAARDQRVLVGQGNVGKYVLEVMDAGRATEARWIIYLSAVNWFSGAQALEAIAPLRAILSGGAARFAYNDAVASRDALSEAETAKSNSVASAAELEKFIEEKAVVFDNLEKLYRSKLVLEEPAALWQKIAGEKSNLWKLWLGIFGALVVIPLTAVVFKWEAVTAAVASLTVGATGTISVAGLATITVPALFYAWLLKNVSRIFIQNLSLADDAAHRRALAITYLGLVANSALNISEQERALVLNALFRPIPPNSSDDGPPSGLLDLIKSKTT